MITILTPYSDYAINIKYSRADMCFSCSLSVKSIKFGMMIVFKALKKKKNMVPSPKSPLSAKNKSFKWRPFWTGSEINIFFKTSEFEQLG